MSAPNGFRVLGLGSALPARRVPNAELTRSLDTSDEWIRSRSGIEARHLVGPDESTSRLAAIALGKALAEAGVDGTALDLLIVATSTPDSPCPATAARVAAAVGADAAAFDLNGACSGFVHALQVGVALLATSTTSTIAVIGADRYSTLVDPTDRSTAVLFGDGAGAVVLRRGESADGFGLLGADSGGDGEGLAALQVPPGADHLHMDGPELFRSATRAMARSSLAALANAGLDAAAVDLFVPHQANARIITAVGERIGIEPSRHVVDLAQRANTSAASIPLALDTARATGRLTDGTLLLLSGVGAGLGWASAVVRWSR